MFYQNHLHTILTTNHSIKRYRRALTIFAIWIAIAVISSYFAINEEKTIITTFKQQMAVPIKSRRTRSTTNNEGVKAENGVKIEELGPRPIFFEHDHHGGCRLGNHLRHPPHQRYGRENQKRNGGNRQSHLGQTIHRSSPETHRQRSSRIKQPNDRPKFQQKDPWGPMAFITSLLGTWFINGRSSQGPGRPKWNREPKGGLPKGF